MEEQRSGPERKNMDACLRRLKQELVRVLTPTVVLLCCYYRLNV